MKKPNVNKNKKFDFQRKENNVFEYSFRFFYKVDFILSVVVKSLFLKCSR